MLAQHEGNDTDLAQKRKPLEILALDALALDTAPRLRTLHHAPPPSRGRGVMVKDVAALVSALAARGVL